MIPSDIRLLKPGRRQLMSKPAPKMDPNPLPPWALPRSMCPKPNDDSPQKPRTNYFTNPLPPMHQHQRQSDSPNNENNSTASQTSTHPSEQTPPQPEPRKVLYELSHLWKKYPTECWTSATNAIQPHVERISQRHYGDQFRNFDGMYAERRTMHQPVEQCQRHPLEQFVYRVKPWEGIKPKKVKMSMRHYQGDVKMLARAWGSGRVNWLEGGECETGGRENG